jgi:hypothetical protein
MSRIAFFVTIVLFVVMPLMAANGTSVKGTYVEARTAEVFVGGCLMGSEAETSGRQAVLAWKIDRGNINGVSLDGLSIVAAVVGDKNLGIHELGGAKPNSKSTLIVDARATDVQRDALIGMVKKLTNVVGTVVNVTSGPIEFTDKGSDIAVKAPRIALTVDKHPEHDPGCGAEQWFHPLALVQQPTIGKAVQHAYSGQDLGSRWSDPDKVSAFFGTFSY